MRKGKCKAKGEFKFKFERGYFWIGEWDDNIYFEEREEYVYIEDQNFGLEIGFADFYELFEIVEVDELVLK